MPPMRAGVPDLDPSHSAPNLRKNANIAGESWDFRTTIQRPNTRALDLVVVRVAFAELPWQPEATCEPSKSCLPACRSRTQRSHLQPEPSFDPRLPSPSLSPSD